MVIRLKDAAKLTGISIVTCCAVLVCAMFLNFYMDVAGVRGEITSEAAMIFYEAQISTAKVVCVITGGCLFLTSVIMLAFYVKHYIDMHKRELGILKALGYSNLQVAKHFRVFGLSVLMGTAPGFGGAFLLMPFFYELQNKEGLLPEFMVHFHPVLLLLLVFLPALVFGALAVVYGCWKLRRPVLTLLGDSFQPSVKKRRRRTKVSSRPFAADLRRSTLKKKKVLVFFMAFASFCFSAMTQMSSSMKELSSVMMGIMILLIGLVLSCTTLFLAMTTVVNGNAKTIAMMKVFGYSRKECSRAILGGYRIPAYAGFAAGTVYQYALLRIVVDTVFGDMEGIPEYSFDVWAMAVSFATFVVIYEIVMYVYSEKIEKASVKEVMLEKFR